MTPARTGQYIHKSVRWWVTRTNTGQSGLQFHFAIFVESSSKLHWHGEVWPFSWFTNQTVSVFQTLQTGCTDLVQEMMTVRRTTVSATKAGVSVHWDTTLLLRQQQDLCGLWVVYLHFCCLCLCSHPVILSHIFVSVNTLSFCHIHFCYTW